MVRDGVPDVFSHKSLRTKFKPAQQIRWRQRIIVLQSGTSVHTKAEVGLRMNGQLEHGAHADRFDACQNNIIIGVIWNYIKRMCS